MGLKDRLKKLESILKTKQRQSITWLLLDGQKLPDDQRQEAEAAAKAQYPVGSIILEILPDGKVSSYLNDGQASYNLTIWLESEEAKELTKQILAGEGTE